MFLDTISLSLLAYAGIVVVIVLSLAWYSSRRD
jgi:hypothetical protein